MRLIDQRPTTHQHSFPLVVMALGDQQQGEACHHYRTAQNYGDHLTIGGPEIIFSSGAEAGELPDGITPDSILAICEDRAKSQMHGTPSMHLVVLQLQAARRALATDESSGTFHPTQAGGDSNQTGQAHANASQ